MMYFLYVITNNLKNDAKIINETGIIRGSIQRAAKLILSDSIQVHEGIIDDIDVFIEDFLDKEWLYCHGRVEKHILNDIRKLKGVWENLKPKLREYQKSKSGRLRKEIIRESEKCWKIADTVVLNAQLANEYKMSGFKTFYIIIFLDILSAAIIILLIFLYVRQKLEHETVRDPLTNLYNRRFYENVIEVETARSKRYNLPLSLIIFDIDHFKDINDTYGHKAGDRALIDLAGVVINSVRKSDSVFRVGGEEFAIINTDTDLEGAFELSEKFRKKVANYVFQNDIKVTISLGVAQFHGDITKDELYYHADKALYLAKSRGRNRTEVFKQSAGE